MLKTLLKEVGRQWRRPSPGAARMPDGRDLARRAAFSQSNAEERRALVQRLQDELSTGHAQLDDWTVLGDWLLALGQPADAEPAYRQALARSPLHARAQEGLGLALLQLRRLEEAYLHFETAHKQDADNADILIHWGLVDLELGNLNKAGSKFQRAIERDPNNSHAWHNLGLVALKQGDLDASIGHLNRTIQIKPDHGLAYSNLALAYRHANQLEQALAAAEQAVRYKAGNARVFVVLGDLLINAARFEEAEQALQQALVIEPRAAEVHIGFGKLYAAWGRHDQAKASYAAALAINPSQADARGGLAQLQLLLGEWSTGWDLYEARRETDAAPVRNMPFLEWQGEPLDGKTLLVHAEQGLGDIMLFASCLPDLLATRARCVVEVPTRLQRLFARSFPTATVVGHDAPDRGLTWLEQLPAIDRHVPMGSLPRQFRRGAQAFPQHAGYLRAGPEQVATWQDKLSSLPGPRIGVAWRGGLAATAGAQRTLDLIDMIRALKETGATVVSLQYGDVTADLDAVRNALGIEIVPGPSGFGDLDEAAALTAALDGVITVCSTQAHLTGALGVPGLVLVPANPNWRYGATGTGSPWYPSLTLVRQTALGDWHHPLNALAPWVNRLMPRR